LAQGQTTASGTSGTAGQDARAVIRALASQVIAKGKSNAEVDGARKLRNDGCVSPCVKVVYVEPTVQFPITITSSGRGTVKIDVVVDWEAGILCFDPKLPAKKTGVKRGPPSRPKKRRSAKKKPRRD